MAIHQISVFLENRAGQLAEITALLAKNNIDLRAINIAETSDYGVLRLIASHEPDVQYMYSIFGQPNGMAYMILRVADPAEVSSLLHTNGMQLAGAAELGIVSSDQERQE